MQLSRQQLRQHRDPRGEQRAQQEAQQTDHYSARDKAGHEPEDELHDNAEKNVEHHHAPLAEPVRDVGEHQAANGQAAPEAGGDVADFAGFAAADTDQEFDDPACGVC